MNDILKDKANELKKCPYTVPEGYFDSLRHNIKRNGQKGRNVLTLVTPYIAMAASFALLVTAGTFFLKKVTAEDTMTYEDYIVHSDHYSIYIESDMEEQEEISDEDLVNYLIYSGVTAEVIELSK